MSILTKLFIVLQLVVSLALAVLVVVAFKQQEPYKANLETTNKAMLAAQAGLLREQNVSKSLNAQVTQLQGERSTETASWATQVESLNNALAAKSTQIDILESKNSTQGSALAAALSTVASLKDQLGAKDKELAELRPNNIDLIAKNAELNRVNNDLATQKSLAEKAIRKLQEELAAAPEGKPGATGPSDNKSLLATVQTPVQINGKINDVITNNGRTYVELGLGSRDGVKVETQFSVYRGNTYVGDAVVKRATVDGSVALVTLVREGQTVQKGDLVISGIGN